MRTASDVLTNPEPGDVLVYGPQWQRSRIEVTEIRDGCVLAVMDGRGDCLYYPNQWREWMVDAEVLHVAE
jgi:hypothetical protein